MSEPPRRVKTGEPLRIPASTYNSFIDAALDLQRRQQARQLGQQVPQPALGDPYLGIVQVRNDSGGPRNRFDVLGVDVPLFTPSVNLDSFRGRIVLRGVTPTADHVGRFLVLLEPASAGAIVQACALGVCPVRVDVGSADHAFADVVAGQTDHLKSGDTGSASILWCEAGTSVRWAIVRVTGPSGAGGSGLPAGTGQYKVLQLSATDVPYWDWVRAH